MKSRFVLSLYAIPLTVLLLAGCGNLPPLEDSEPAAGEEEYADASSTAPEEDPLQQHLRARSKVNPKNMGEAAYTKHVPPPGQKPDDTRLAAIEDEVADMDQQMKVMTAGISAPTPTHKPALIIDGRRVITEVPPQKPIMQQAAVQPVSIDQSGGQEFSGSGASVTDVRLGDHPDKTRLVLDLDARSAFQFDLDNGQHALRINLPGTTWGTQQQKIFPNHPLIAGYAAHSLEGGGTSLVIALKKNARVLLSSAFPPDQGKSDRIVFDIGPG
jgi:hypothetical protein